MNEPEWAAMHDQRWPWCPLRMHWHTHEDRLNGGTYVNGRPAGPIWTLRDSPLDNASPGCEHPFR